MPRINATLSDKEVRMACVHWVENGCPEAIVSGVHMQILPGSNDPRERSGPTVTATVTIKDRSTHS